MELLTMVFTVSVGITVMAALLLLLRVNYWMLTKARESGEFIDWVMTIGYFALIFTAVTGTTLAILTN